jgi:uncharacterized repeat protein (TIGR02543 family)
MATINNKQITRIYIGSKMVYCVGAIVNYVVDGSTIYQEEIDGGESALSPKSFTPSKPGWTFVGWRSDTAASGNVLTSKIVENDTPFTLYAVFR